MKVLALIFACLAISWSELEAKAGFLFVTFAGEQSPLTEQIYFGVSEDGRKWDALNGGQPILISALGEKGVRDPYLLRAADGKKFFLIATDLSINLNPDWKRAIQAGSQSLVIWESTDLTNWYQPRLAKVAPDDAGCAWAPEAIYDETKAEYLVFWASTTKRDGFAKHRIWACWTKDFNTFGPPFVYIEAQNHVIDTTIVKERGQFYRFTKNESSKAITMESSTTLDGTWETVPQFSLAKLEGYEGPECYVIGPAAAGAPATWCLILDHYSRQGGYQPFVSSDLSTGRFTPGEGFSFPFKFRHGSVLQVSAEEMQRLLLRYNRSK